LYPKKFFAEYSELVEDRSVFILIPFSSDFEPIYKLIKQILESPEFNLSCYRSDEIYKPGPIIETILRGIASSQFVIADVTGRNPNVFYELGIAHTVKDFCVILTQNIEDVPFDLRHLHCIIYENSVSVADKLKHDLRKAVLAILKEYDKASKIEMSRQKHYSLVLDNKPINSANLKSIDEPKLEVSHVVIDCELIDAILRLNSGYNMPFLKAKIHLDISNKESRWINIISIEIKTRYVNDMFQRFGLDEVLVSRQC
jgi:hypothetical protein